MRVARRAVVPERWGSLLPKGMRLSAGSSKPCSRVPVSRLKRATCRSSKCLLSPWKHAEEGPASPSSHQGRTGGHSSRRHFKAVLVDNSHLYGEALSEAGRWVVRHPKLTHMLDNRDPVATAMLNTFIRQPAVWAYLRTLRVTRHRETAQQLLDKAHARIHGGGQTSAIVSLYRSYDAGGRLTDLSPSQFAVLRTTFGHRA